MIQPGTIAHKRLCMLRDIRQLSHDAVCSSSSAGWMQSTTAGQSGGSVRRQARRREPTALAAGSSAIVGRSVRRQIRRPPGSGTVRTLEVKWPVSSVRLEAIRHETHLPNTQVANPFIRRALSHRERGQGPPAPPSCSRTQRNTDSGSRRRFHRIVKDPTGPRRRTDKTRSEVN